MELYSRGNGVPQYVEHDRLIPATKSLEYGHLTPAPKYTELDGLQSSTTPGYNHATYTNFHPLPNQANTRAYQPLTQQQTFAVVNTQPTVAHSLTSKPKSYMSLSIFTCLYCCWLLGILAIMYSAKVNSSWSAGDYEGAHQLSRTALRLNIVSVLVGVMLGILGAISTGIYYDTTGSTIFIR